ncbi:MAG: SRPBCC family protein [Acidimicrobiales bacterium]
MKIENDFRVAAPIEQAWALLTDIPAIAPCLPGAELTGQEGDDFHGQMKVKVGPVTAEYAGTATVVEMNETDRIVVLKASGRDKRGAGNASADITATMTEDGDGTVVAISTDLKVSGKVAQFGRGVMADVSKKLLGQFAECIEGKLDRPEGGDGSAAEESAAIDDRAAAPATDPGDGKGEQEDDVLDLLEVAGGAVAKRLIPTVIAVVAVVVLVILVLG